MICAPNTYRAGVVGGFVIEPPAMAVQIYFTPNSTWIGVGFGAGSWVPEVGEEIEFLIDDSFSGMPMVVGAAFNYRGAWAAKTAYAVNDVFVWYDPTSGQLFAWLVTNAFTSGSTFNTGDVKAMNFRGAYASGTAYTTADLVLANDLSGNLQTWVALSSFTSSGAFAQGSLWAGCLAASTIFYVAAVNDGSIQISTTLGGTAVTFMSGGFFVTPNTAPELTAYFGLAGFGAGSGLTPALSVGALWANNVPWVPSTPPSCPAAPANQLSYLAYHAFTGLYWTTNPLGNTALDAVLGWVLTNATDILAASIQNIAVGDESLGSGELPGIVPFIASNVPPLPTCGIASAGAGEVTFDAITFSGSPDTSQLNSAVIVLLYQDATAAATAHLTAALASGIPLGTPATLSLDTDLTGIAFEGDWILAGGEMMFITADATSGGVAVDRALGLTTAEAHAIGQSIYLLVQVSYSYAFPLGFFSSANAATWGPTEQLQNANIALFNIVVFNAAGAESDESPINYSQSMGGLIATGVGSSGSGFLAHAVAGIVAAAAHLNFGIARSFTAGPLTAPTQIGAINTTGLAPFLYALTVMQDSVGGRPMIPVAPLTVALSTAQSTPNSQVTGLFLYDGAGNHILLSTTGDIPIP